MQNPIRLIIRAIAMGLAGRTRFERNLSTEHLFDRGERFIAFRKVVVNPATDQSNQPGAIFQVRFRFKNLSAAANRQLSLIPIPLIVAQPGFRSKTWLLGQETGNFIGSYEFDSIEDAEAYWDSLPPEHKR